jgi:hypothetical protein
VVLKLWYFRKIYQKYVAGEDQLELSCEKEKEIVHSMKEERNILHSIKEKEG